MKAIICKFKLGIFHLEETLVLSDQRVLGLGEDVLQGALVELVEVGDDRQAAHQLGDHLRRVLAVGVQTDHRLAAREIVPGRHGEPGPAPKL